MYEKLRLIIKWTLAFSILLIWTFLIDYDKTKLLEESSLQEVSADSAIEVYDFYTKKPVNEEEIRNILAQATFKIYYHNNKYEIEILKAKRFIKRNDCQVSKILENNNFILRKYPLLKDFIKKCIPRGGKGGMPWSNVS